MTDLDPTAVIAHSALRALPTAAREELASAAVVVDVPAGAALVREGDAADAMYVVCEGRLELRLHQRQHELPTATLGPYDLLGWSWFVEPHVWTVDVVAPAGATLLRLPRPALLEVVERDPVTGRAMGELLVGVLSRRLRDTRVQLLDLFGGGSPAGGGVQG